MQMRAVSSYLERGRREGAVDGGNMCAGSFLRKAPVRDADGKVTRACGTHVPEVATQTCMCHVSGLAIQARIQARIQTRVEG